MQFYTGHVMTDKKTAEIYDEEIVSDTANAGGLTMGVMIPVMSLITTLFLKKNAPPFKIRNINMLSPSCPV